MQRPQMNLRLNLLFLIFGISCCGLFFVGYIVYQGATNLSVVQMRQLLDTTATAILASHPNIHSDPQICKTWIDSEDLLASPQYVTLVLKNKKKVVAFRATGELQPSEDFQDMVRSAMPNSKLNDQILTFKGDDYIGTGRQINNSDLTFFLLYRTSSDTAENIVKNLVVPSLIAGGFALWGSVWMAIILSKLMVKNREKKALEVMVQERTLELKQARDQAEASDQLKSQLITTMSHELRTPLTSIIGAIRLIDGGVVGVIPDKVKNLSHIAWSNAQQLSKLLDDILDVDRLDAGALKIDQMPVDISEMVRRSVELNNGYASEYQVELKIESLAQSLMVCGDEPRLLQVMANLISNAAKFSPSKETIRISATRSQKNAKIAITNLGPAIPDDIQKTLFEKFVRGDNLDNRNKNGAGLGLNIAKEIILKHNGSIDYVSNSSNGTTFFVELPLMDHNFS